VGEEVRGAVDTLLGQFAGPYAFGVTTPPGQWRVLDDDSFGEAVANLIGGVFFIARVAPDADIGLVTEAFDEIARSTADGEDAVGWPHEVVVADDWLAFNAVPPPLAVEDVPQDLLASDQLYQWVRRGFIQNGSNVYVNLEALEKAILGPLVSSDELAAIKPLRALGISTQTEPAGDAHAHLTVLIVSE